MTKRPEDVQEEIIEIDNDGDVHPANKAMTQTKTDRERVERIREWFDAPVEDFADVADDFHAVVDGFRDILKAARVDDVDGVIRMLEEVPRLVTTIEMQCGGWKTPPGDIKEMLAPFRAAQAACDAKKGQGATPG